MVADDGLIRSQQAATIPEKKGVDFATYCLLWSAAIHHHHQYVCSFETQPYMSIEICSFSIEETSYFPMFSHKFDTSFVEAEHSTFTPGLEELHNHLVSCIPTGAKYGINSVAEPHEQQKFDGERVVAIIDGFAEPLCQHVCHRVPF